MAGGAIMSENLNLALDFLEPAARAAPDRRRAVAARVYVSMACCYLKDGGAPTITADCGSYAELEREVNRLKAECDAILRDAEDRFRRSDPTARESRESHAEVATAVTDRERVTSRAKTPIRLEQPLRVSDRMTREVRTLQPNDKLSIADELMKVGKFRHVVVVDGDDSGEVVGVVSHRDIFYGALAWSLGQGTSAHQRALETLPVKNVMQGEVTTVAPEAPLTDAARTMLERRIGCLPVVENERLVGILTEGDFLSMLTEVDPSA
jgi:CBS domain-containing protein